MVVEWPHQPHQRALARATGHACLLVVAPGSEAPHDCGVLEDWVTTGTPANEVEHRLRTLAAHRELVGGPLQALARPVELPRADAAVHRELIAGQGRPVPLATLRTAYIAAGGSAARRAFDAMLRTLTHQLAEHGQQLDRLDRDEMLLSVPSRRSPE
jgi:hypothetical protein